MLIPKPLFYFTLILSFIPCSTMTTLEQIQQDLQTLSEAEHELLYGFIQLLKRSHSISPSNSFPVESSSFLDVAGEFVGCLEGGPSNLGASHLGISINTH